MGKNGRNIISRVQARCIKRSRKYTLKDLNELRHLKVCREMPTNILCETDILSPGLGLGTVPMNSLSTSLEVRFKQIQLGKKLDGYKKYISLIPKHERIPNVHPVTPTKVDILALSKRNFDKNVKKWKKDIHLWDSINSASEIPHHLLTKNMLNKKSKQSSSTTNRRHRGQSQFSWNSPRTKIRQRLPSSSRSENDYKEERKWFDDTEKTGNNKALYSSRNNKWYKPKNGKVAHVKREIIKTVAVECLKRSILNVRSKQKKDENQDDHKVDQEDKNNFDESLVK